MAGLCVRVVRHILTTPSLSRRTPRLLCTAAQQKSSGGPEEETGAQKPEQGATEKLLTEEKVQLEEQLKELTVRRNVKCYIFISP
ncbi:hypothetical protein PGIGA_G00198450 [Pangasianodon gigas]|uniref:Uncharacterized protein n=1 Tax=Pangasianodon gigas TaxID=30993 RepID=A0ACC5WDU8_PANGG|nr:hypothetical protein [Pangasianodon gigas]